MISTIFDQGYLHIAAGAHYLGKVKVYTSSFSKKMMHLFQKSCAFTFDNATHTVNKKSLSKFLSRIYLSNHKHSSFEEYIAWLISSGGINCYKDKMWQHLSCTTQRRLLNSYRHHLKCGDYESALKCLRQGVPTIPHYVNITSYGYEDWSFFPNVLVREYRNRRKKTSTVELTEETPLSLALKNSPDKYNEIARQLLITALIEEYDCNPISIPHAYTITMNNQPSERNSSSIESSSDSDYSVVREF